MSASNSISLDVLCLLMEIGRWMVDKGDDPHSTIDWCEVDNQGTYISEEDLLRITNEINTSKERECVYCRIHNITHGTEQSFEWFIHLFFNSRRHFVHVVFHFYF